MVIIRKKEKTMKKTFISLFFIIFFLNDVHSTEKVNYDEEIKLTTETIRHYSTCDISEIKQTFNQDISVDLQKTMHLMKNTSCNYKDYTENLTNILANYCRQDMINRLNKRLALLTFFKNKQ
jgi:hypothetical protein